MKTLYDLSAGVIVVVHLLYVLFAVGGQAFILAGAFFGWEAVRNGAFRVTHLTAVGLVAIEAVMGIDCPLTVWEYELRGLAGRTVEEQTSFIAHLAHLVIFYDFPRWVFTIAQIGFGFLVVFTYILIPPRFKGRR